MLKCAWINMLESSAVSLPAGTAHADYPLYRLHDRDIGRIFKSTAAETIEVKIDQGAAGNLAVDRLLIPAGHNLDGVDLYISYSDDDVDYSLAVPFWNQSGGGLINKSWAAATHRYWKFTASMPSSAPQLAEIFLTSTYEWELNPSNPVGPMEDVHNVEHLETASGHDRFLVHGDPKRQRKYRVEVAGEAQKDNILALYEGYGGAKPFWLEDVDGDWIYGRLRSPLKLERISYQLYNFDLDFLEVLP